MNLKLTRNQLASFLDDHENIKQFETLFSVVDEIQGTITSQTGTDTETALSRAQEAIDIIQSVQTTVDTLATAQTPTNNTSETTNYIDFNLNAPHADREGRLVWNTDATTLEIISPGPVIGQVGLDMFMLVVNDTGATIDKGTSVGFAGVNGGDRIKISPFLADGTDQTLYYIGVTAQDIEDGEEGRVVVYGRVVNIDTTGTPVSENWSVGDLLWASPSSAGALTNVKPTAPDNVVSVAAVLSVNATTGKIFVRPVIEQQKYYGEFTKTTNQSPAVINTAYTLTFDTTEISLGVSIGSPASRIVCENSGLYQFNCTIQITSSSSSAKNVWVWFRKNGVDLANTSRIVSSDINNGYVPVTLSEFFSLTSNDYIEVAFASDNTNVSISTVASTSFSPQAPAAVLSVSQIQQ